MRFNICSNLENGAGLQRDYLILRALLESFGHQVRGIQFNHVEDRAPADVNIFLETIKHDLIPYAAQNAYVVNPEWFGMHLFPVVARFNLILAKTYDCERICKQMYPNGGPRIIYTGWESLDLLNPDVPREPHFLHVAGNSQTKNTPAVFAAWATGRIPAPLTVLSRWYPNPGIPNVTVRDRITDEEHHRLMNACLYHMCPSQYEGWGHSLNEALGVGGIVVSMNARPMTEFGIHPTLLVESVKTTRYNNGILHTADPDHIVNAAHLAMNMSEEQKQTTRNANREGFLARRKFFHEAIKQLWG
jgi:glycosyl transferase family 1